MGVMKRVTMAMGVLGVALVAAPQAHGQAAIITNGTITLGVNAGGALNVSCGSPGAANTTRCTTDSGPEAGPSGGVGLYNNVTHNEATFDGCTCEGWGAGVSGGAEGGVWGGQNTAVGGISGSSVGNTSAGVMTFDASTATSTVTISDALGNPVMQVVQAYHPSASAGLYQVDVTITNLTNDVLGSPTDGIVYRREMDWDIEPTNTFEYSTINGNGAANLLGTSDDGFESSNPFSGRTSDCGGSPVDADFVDSGPCDHGALFDFGFDALAVGASKSFTIFYGAADNVKDALGDLAAVGADNVYSLAQAGGTGANGGGSGSGDYTDDCLGDTACIAAKETFIFGFKGVGGVTVTGSPEPASIALMGTGLLGLAGVARRRRASKES